MDEMCRSWGVLGATAECDRYILAGTRSHL